MSGLVEFAKTVYGAPVAKAGSPEFGDRSKYGKGTVLYRRANAAEERAADRRATRAQLALPAIVGGTSAAAGAAATAPLGWKAMRRTGGRMGVVGGVIGGGMALAARTGYKREKAKHGMWTYETSRRSDEKFARNTVRRGRQATLAGNPNPDGEGFYGFNSRRASRLPGDTTTTE